VYAFGVMLFEALRNRISEVLVADKSEAQFAAYTARVASGARSPIPDDWPPAVASLVAECWAQEPERRPGMEDVVAYMRGLADDGTIEAWSSGGTRPSVGEAPGREGDPPPSGPPSGRPSAARPPSRPASALRVESPADGARDGRVAAGCRCFGGGR